MGFVEHKMNLAATADTSIGPSTAIWADCPVDQIDSDPSVGYGFFDDFVGGGLITSPTTSAALVGLPYSGFGSGGSTITYADEIGGAITLSETTDNEGLSLFTLQTPFQINVLTQPLWFEARIKPSHTATTEQSMFVGLADNTAKTATSPLTATAGALANDCNLVGFHKLDTDLLVLKTGYKANGIAVVDLESCAAAVEATTYVKLGFTVGTDHVLRYFINGIEQATTFTLADILGTDFPGDVRLGPCISMLLGVAASDNTLIMDWWGCYQLRV